MDFPIEDKNLKVASAKLSFCLYQAVRVLNWHSWEKTNVKDEAKREKITEKFDEMESQVRDNSSKAAAVINESLHIFAAKSDLYAIDSEAPPRHPLFWYFDEYDEIIGTSAHHACLLFLRRCIAANFWKDNQSIQDRWKSELLPKLNQNQLRARMAWERFRVFETSNFNVDHDYEDLPPTGELIEIENTGMTAGQICDEIGFGKSTWNKYRKQVKVPEAKHKTDKYPLGSVIEVARFILFESTANGNTKDLMRPFLKKHGEQIPE